MCCLTSFIDRTKQNFLANAVLNTFPRFFYLPQNTMDDKFQIHLSENSFQHVVKNTQDASFKDSLEEINSLLQKNHDDHHMFWRDVGGHNHIAHSLLTVLALGGGPSELRRAYDDGLAVQRPAPPLDLHEVEAMADAAGFQARMGRLEHYTNFLAFFKREMTQTGGQWRHVVLKYCFARTPLAEAMLASLYEGAYHPIIHLGFGVEFGEPGIVAEALAQAAAHDPNGIGEFFVASERQADKNNNRSSRPLIDLIAAVRADKKIRHAARAEDGPRRVSHGVLGRAGAEIAQLAAEFRVRPENLQERTAEMISCAAYMAGAAQRRDKPSKVDFFHMHNVTSSIFFGVFARQPWIAGPDKARLVEWKARLDLVWYAACGAPELHLDRVFGYVPDKSRGMDWDGLFKAVNLVHDDGHIAKLARALKYGEEIMGQLVLNDSDQAAASSYPVSGELWFRIAQMAYDTTVGLTIDDMWIWGAGFPQMWAGVPTIPPPVREIPQIHGPEDESGHNGSAVASMQEKTLYNFIEKWKAWTPEGMISCFDGDYTQTPLPFSLGQPTRSRDEVECGLPMLMQLITNYKLTINEIVHDPARGRAAVYAISTGDSPVGEWTNEYAVFMTFNVTGDKIASLREMVDSAFMEGFFAKVRELMTSLQAE